MRIIGGRFSGRTLAAPPGRATRPTSDRVREAMFNALASRMDFADTNVVDLFAGSGALALEALSRGAARATLVDHHAPTLQTARANAAALGVTSACRFVRADVLAWLRRPGPPATGLPATGLPATGVPAGLAFADPPYDWAEIPSLPALVRPHLAPDALFVLEHDIRHRFDDTPGLVFTRTYGRTVVSLFERDGGWAVRTSL